MGLAYIAMADFSCIIMGGDTLMELLKVNAVNNGPVTNFSCLISSHGSAYAPICSTSPGTITSMLKYVNNVLSRMLL